jgi:hypothetical protein
MASLTTKTMVFRDIPSRPRDVRGHLDQIHLTESIFQRLLPGFEPSSREPCFTSADVSK